MSFTLAHFPSWTARRRCVLFAPVFGLICWTVGSQFAVAAPAPTLTTLFPAGAKAGTQVDVTLTGNVSGTTGLRCSHPDIVAEPLEKNQFRLTIPATVPVGQYDIQAVSPNGLSSPRTLTVGSLDETVEVEPNNAHAEPQTIAVNQVVHGRIDRGDLDFFSFTASRGQRVIIDCEAERIDSKLRGVLELYDADGRRLAANRGWQGIDPLIDFQVEKDGVYSIRVSDLIYSGSPEHFYRLSLETGPKIAFSVPCVIEQGRSTPVTLYGWNLSAAPNDAAETFDSVTVDITPPQNPTWDGLRIRSEQVGMSGFAYRFPNAATPVLIGLSDVPVTQEGNAHQTPKTAATIPFPCEVSGQLLEGDETDWYAVELRRGEVLWLEGFAERIGSDVDLDVSIFDVTGTSELARFRDAFRVPDLPQFPASHSDPSGRFVAPADGQFLIVVRSLLGSLDSDPRRLYRLSLRREEPDFELVAVPQTETFEGWNVPAGGTLALDLLAFRKRGLTDGIRVRAENLPPGVSCPDVWLGPGVDSVPLVISAHAEAELKIHDVQFIGESSVAGSHPVRAGVLIQKGPPTSSVRISSAVPFAVASDSPVRLSANAHEPLPNDLYGELPAVHAPGCIVDVAVRVDRRDIDHLAPVQLMGYGLPELVENQTAIIPAGKDRGVISFYLPPTLPVGKYSFMIQGETTVPVGPKPATGERKTRTITVATNTVTIDVQPASYVVSIDPFAPRKIHRGEVIKLNYSARRINGFINKIHTELEAPGGVVGLRGRGVTFVGGTEKGTIQIIASDDAPLGAQPFLRLNAVGTLEDQPILRGSCFLHLEIVE